VWLAVYPRYTERKANHYILSKTKSYKNSKGTTMKEYSRSSCGLYDKDYRMFEKDGSQGGMERRLKH